MVSNFLQPLYNFIHSGILGQRTNSVCCISVHHESLHNKHQLGSEHSHFAVKLPIYLLQSILQPINFIMQSCSLLLEQFPKLLIRMR